MTTFLEDEVVCPVCANELKIPVMMSTNFMGQHTDFHRITMGWSPLALAMHTCPQCGFTGSNEEFEPEHVLSDAFKQSILTEIQPLVNNTKLDAGRRYELYALIQELNGADVWDMANHYLRAAWAAMDDGSPRETDYRRHALTFFQKALNEHKVPPESLAPITYLVGELYRRIGDANTAKTWFNRVIDQAKQDSAWKPIAEIAQRQRDTPQNKF